MRELPLSFTQLSKRFRWHTALLRGCTAAATACLLGISCVWPLLAHLPIQLADGGSLGEMQLRQFWECRLTFADFASGASGPSVVIVQAASLLLLRCSQAASWWAFSWLSFPRTCAS